MKVNNVHQPLRITRTINAVWGAKKKVSTLTKSIVNTFFVITNHHLQSILLCLKKDKCGVANVIWNKSWYKRRIMTCEAGVVEVLEQVDSLLLHPLPQPAPQDLFAVIVIPCPLLNIQGISEKCCNFGRIFSIQNIILKTMIYLFMGYHSIVMCIYIKQRSDFFSKNMIFL